jgi:GNAT superfamily N-acetyltransferase
MLTDFTIIHELAPAHLDDLMDLFAPEFWTLHRKREEVERMIRHTDLLFAAVDRGDRLVGFCRVLTDFVYRAMLYDVIVAGSHRGSGLGRLLLNAVVEHPRLKSVEKIDLRCKPDKVSFYRKWGFEQDDSGTLFLRRLRAERL